MAFSLNKIMLIGNLGKDAETRFTTTNVSVTTFSLATTFSYKGKDGNWVNETTWHNIISFNLSDYFKDLLKKGKKFYVEGRLTKREYTDKEGIKRYMTEVHSDRIIPLEARGEEGESAKESAGFESTSEGEVPVDEAEDLPF
jgi:single-strand DNA-binding protein